MNFQDLKKIENAKFFMDLAFNNAAKKADIKREKKMKDMKNKSKTIEIERIQAVEQVLVKQMQKILENFPLIDELDEFYLELIKNYVDYVRLKKALGAVNWIIPKIRRFTSEYVLKIKKCWEKEKINGYRREYYGRISSLLKRIDKDFKFLEETRKLMRKFPVVKGGMPTICIAGFPNVGKTTLLTKLTTSKAEINSYAFTTKGLNTGYLTYGYLKVQFIDTPGTLNRPEKMNFIENSAYLAIKHCADIIIYVFDLTEPYPIEKQLKLYQQVKKYKKPIMVYLSKADILEKEEIDEFIEENNKMEFFYDSEKLKKEILGRIKKTRK